MSGQAGRARGLQELGLQLSSATCWVLNGRCYMHILLACHISTAG